jgi:hypothetical protein
MSKQFKCAQLFHYFGSSQKYSKPASAPADKTSVLLESRLYEFCSELFVRMEVQMFG